MSALQWEDVMIGLLADRIVDVPLTNTGERALHCSRRHMHPGISLLRSETYRSC